MQSFNAVGRACIALYEVHGILDVSYNSAIEVLAVQDVDLRGPPRQQACDIGLGEKATHVLGKKEYSGVSEQKFAIRPLGGIYVDQNILHTRPAGDARNTDPSVELLAVEVVRVDEPRTRCEIEADGTFGAEKIADFIAAQFLRHRTLSPEKAIAALHWFGIALPDVDREHVADRLDLHRDRRIAIAGDILDPGAQCVGVPDSGYDAVIPHAEKDLPSDGVGQRDHFACERRREAFLVLQSCAFTLFEEDIEVSLCHRASTDRK